MSLLSVKNLVRISLMSAVAAILQALLNVSFDYSAMASTADGSVNVSTFSEASIPTNLVTPNLVTGGRL